MSIGGLWEGYKKNHVCHVNKNKGYCESFCWIHKSGHFQEKTFLLTTTCTAEPATILLCIFAQYFLCFMAKPIFLLGKCMFLAEFQMNAFVLSTWKAVAQYAHC